MTSSAWTQQQSGIGPPVPRPSTVVTLSCLASALVLIAAFFAIQSARIPIDGMTTYDESTHIFEAGQVRDILEHGSLSDLADYFLSTKVMKGVLYRLWYGAGFLILPFGVDSARTIAVAAACLALLAVYFLARRVAPAGFGDVAGLVAVAAGCLSPLLHTHGRTAMVEPLNLATLVLALFCVVRDRQLGTWPSAILAAIGIVIAFVTKYNHALILVLAIAVDAAIEARRRRGWRPFLPLALALAPLLGLLANPARLKGFAYYVWTIPGGNDPIDPTGWLYPLTLATRTGATTQASLALLVLAAFGAWKSRNSATRVVSLHFAIGACLAQCNDLKLERILVPLTGDLFVLAGLGGVVAWREWSTTNSLAKTAIAAALCLAALVPLNREVFAITPDPMRGFEKWIDEGLAFGAQNPRALWLGGSFDDRVIWNSATLRNRARETNQIESVSKFEYGGTEFFQKSKIDPAALHAGNLDPRALDELLRKYRSLVVLLDPQRNEPRIADRFIDQLWKRIRDSGQYVMARRSLEATVERRPGVLERVRMEFWTRKSAQ